MNFKTTKQWLARARHMDARLRALQESKRVAYDRAVSTTTALGREFTASGQSLPFNDKAALYAHLSVEVDEQIRRLETVRLEILHVIAEVDDNTLAALLTEYYVNGKTWEKVAECLHYSWRWTLHLHGQALQAVQKLLDHRNTA